MDPDLDLVWAAEAYRDGDLDPAQVRILADRLASDPQARAEFLEHLRQAQVFDLLLHDAADDAGLVRRILDSARSGRSEVQAVMGHRLRLPLLRLAMGLAALLAIVVGTWVITDADPDQALTRPAAELVDESVTLVAQGVTHRHWADASTVILADRTKATLRRDGGLDLHIGSVRCQVARQAPGRTWSVDTPYGQVVVVGTRFTVQVDTHRLVVSVEEGRVDLHPLRAGRTQVIQAGEALALDAAGAVQRGRIGDLWQTLWKATDGDLLAGRAVGPGRFATQETIAAQRTDFFPVERYLQFAPPHHGMGTTPLFISRRDMRVSLDLEVEAPVRLWLTWQMQQDGRNFAVSRHLSAGRQQLSLSAADFSDRDRGGLTEGMEVMWYGIWIADAPEIIVHGCRVDVPIPTGIPPPP